MRGGIKQVHREVIQGKKYIKEMLKMKKKKKHILKRLTFYSGRKRILIYVAMLLSAISGVLLLLPMIYIHRIVKNMI